MAQTGRSQAFDSAGLLSPSKKALRIRARIAREISIVQQDLVVHHETTCTCPVLAGALLFRLIQ